jgi:integration host factor subunit beta
MADNSMTKSELIERIVAAQSQSSGSQLTSKDVELAVKTMLEHMSHTLASGERIEIRGIGSFSLHYRSPRIGRNPKTGESVGLAGKHVPHFKPGKELRDRVNAALEQEKQAKQPADAQPAQTTGDLFSRDDGTEL